MEPDFSTLTKKELENFGIYTPIERRLDEQKNPYWVNPVQKILIIHPACFDHAGIPSKTNKKTLAEWVKTRIIRQIPPSNQPAPIFSKGTFVWSFEENKEKKVLFRIIRISECPNDRSEYHGPSLTLLIEWDRAAYSGSGDIVPFPGLFVQTDNEFILNPNPNNKPGHPPISEGDVTHVYPSDFKPFTTQDAAYFQQVSQGHRTKPIVAVMDTGLYYKWEDRRGNPPNPLIKRHYEKNNVKVDFILARRKRKGCRPSAMYGYCGITDYLVRPVPNSRLDVLNDLSTAQILSSPYDDHLVDQEHAGGVIKNQVGRHGTVISAILSHHKCQVLPVKAFSNAGIGMLFDVLCCCNYILSSKRNGLPIQVINASFSGVLSTQNIAIFKNKLRAMTQTHKIWVVASSGNNNYNLDTNPRYPASFGLPLANGGLERVITVNSFYDERVVGNTGMAVSLTVKSSVSNGFLSQLPIANDEPIQGTSFAAAYVSAALASVVASAPASSRAAALSSVQSTNFPTITFS
ncbi:S8 family serine peptidase [Arundinibacter roseus]|uniref:Peptidase S8/S53 domain-containing protein n=1 Tax=Arundinibacter roseus TaxID=2070510 RepID=A0A4R4K7Y8_9BACT|nr:S8 family serine peptidase [Arundinibacter roseus]TDB63787.1 hypothetical protein EZE20_15970 [Arundinibacter roseus]